MLSSLQQLLKLLPATGELVFLGDYIDRGPDARGVVQRLMKLEEERSCVFLRGNHESMALAAIKGDRKAEAIWLANGGVATLESYGGRITPEHLTFLERTGFYHTTPDYIFVHAGLEPEKQPEESDPELLLWIRGDFLQTDYDWGRLVVHGHTPTLNRQPAIFPHRIGIDTGAVYGGHLTALLLPGRQFISV